MNLFPARVITADQTFRHCRFVFDADTNDGIPGIYNRRGQLLRVLELPGGDGTVRTDDPSGAARWWFTAGATVWLVEMDRGGCACKGTRAEPTSVDDLALLAGAPSQT